MEHPARTYVIGPMPLAGADCWICDDLGQATSNNAPRVLRLPPAGTPAFSARLDTLPTHGFAALMLTGVRGIGDVCAVAERCPLDVMPVIDSAAALDQLRAIAQVPGVQRLLFDAAALMADLGLETEQGLLPWRAQIVLASRLAGLARPVDHSALAPEQTRQLGFGARLCFSAAELAAAQAAFSFLDANPEPSP